MKTGYLPAEAQKLAANFGDLDLITLEDQTDALLAALEEIRPENYAGRKPPEKSYELTTQGSELFSFTWASAYFGETMYFKFCLQQDRDGAQPTLYVHSLHKDRPKPKRSVR